MLDKVYIHVDLTFLNKWAFESLKMGNLTESYGHLKILFLVIKHNGIFAITERMPETFSTTAAASHRQ